MQRSSSSSSSQDLNRLIGRPPVLTRSTTISGDGNNNPLSRRRSQPDLRGSGLVITGLSTGGGGLTRGRSISSSDLRRGGSAMSSHGPPPRADRHQAAGGGLAQVNRPPRGRGGWIRRGASSHSRGDYLSGGSAMRGLDLTDSQMTGADYHLSGGSAVRGRRPFGGLGRRESLRPPADQLGGLMITGTGMLRGGSSQGPTRGGGGQARSVDQMVHENNNPQTRRRKKKA